VPAGGIGGFSRLTPFALGMAATLPALAGRIVDSSRFPGRGL
jgi:hypothetical protein